MALQLGALREALISGGVSPDLASKAAEEVATYEGRLASTDARLTLLSWMVGANLAISVTILVKLLH